jgi:hypothetical protein
MKTVVMFLSPIVVDRGEHCTKPKAPIAANDLPAGSAPRLARPLRGGEQRFTVRHHAEALLQLGGATMYDTRTDDGIALELDGQSFQEGVTLLGVNRRCGGLDGGEFVIGQGERHGRLRAWGRP